MDWTALRAQLEQSLSRLEGVAKDKVKPYVDSLEPKLIALATVPADQRAEALKAIEVNARLDLAILGVEAETEAARTVLALVGLLAGIAAAAL